jgi:hypothetical protein
MRRALGYRDAVVALGGDPAILAGLDRALAAALSVATGGLSTNILSIFDNQGRIIRLGRDLSISLRQRLHGTQGADRAQRLEAAHTVIVVSAFFDALGNSGLPFTTRSLRVSAKEEIRLAGGSLAGRELIESLLTLAPPRPTAFLPYERCLDALEIWYRQLAGRVGVFIHQLAVWDELGSVALAEADRYLSEVVYKDAVRRYQESYSQLAVEVPEFAFWSGQVDQQATRSEVRRSLENIESLLLSLSSGQEPADIVVALSNAYRAELRRPILAESQTPTGVRLPTLEESYLDPDFRVKAVQAGELSSDENWWAAVPVRSDLTEYLGEVLTFPEVATAPLVVLGQPGAGKSALTKVLAARLPPGDFLPVRVVLRDAPAEAEIQDQIEYAIRATTGLRWDWPQVVRAAGGAVPVVLMDGFDELLQATGVSQSDYLLRLARFQQREADQGRPLIVLVTSRTAVADRMRYPTGTVALRLEPFRDDQIASWLRTWNAYNEQLIIARELNPLTVDVLTPHRSLASEPLLLLMLAMYDADANALDRAGGTGQSGFDETGLYEELLTSFAAREVAKSHDGASSGELSALVEQELQRLSLIAFSIINRHRQWVTETELDADIAALQGRLTAPVAGFRAPLTQAEAALGRFFFVQRAQAVLDGSRVQTFEFLHATFGEYLAARLTVQLATDLLARGSSLMVGRAAADDDLFYVLLSFAPLSSRQMLRFVKTLCRRQVLDAHRGRLADLLIGVLADSEVRAEHRYHGYRPTRLATSSRHGIYSANLVLLVLALEPAVSAARIFPSSDDPPGTWHRRVLLWRASMTEPDWTDLGLALCLIHTWREDARDLEISLSGTPVSGPEPIDPYWHYHYPPSDPDRREAQWHRPYWGAVFHKMDISGGTNDTSVRHAAEPLFRWIGASITTFHGSVGERASSIAHDLVHLWLSRALDPDDSNLGGAYERLALVFDSHPLWDTQMQSDAMKLVLHFLQLDAARLPATTLSGFLRAAIDLAGQDDTVLNLALEGTLTALRTRTDDDSTRQTLEQIVADVLSAMQSHGLPSALLAWITLHKSGTVYSHLFAETPEAFMERIARSPIQNTHPNLLKQAEFIIANKHTVIG